MKGNVQARKRNREKTIQQCQNETILLGFSLCFSLKAKQKIRSFDIGKDSGSRGNNVVRRIEKLRRKIGREGNK